MHNNTVDQQSIQAEQSTIGGLLLDNEKINDVIELGLIPSDFYYQSNQLVYTAILYQHDRQLPSDVVTLSDYLTSIGQLEACGGLAYLGRIAKDTPSSANTLYYGAIVKQKSTAREVTKLSVLLNNNSLRIGNEESLRQTIDEHQQAITAVSEKLDGINGRQWSGISDLLSKQVDYLEERNNHPGSIVGLETPLTDLNDMTGGFEKGDLIILAARPSMGKTTLLMNFVEHLIRKDRVYSEGKVCLVFSLEMPKEQLISRMMCTISGCDYQQYRKGDLKEDEWSRVTAALHILDQTQLVIADGSGLSVTQMRRIASQVQKSYGHLDMIGLDYIQLASDKTGSRQNRNEEVSAISRGLKGMAKDFNVPVIALSQLNRQLENRSDKRPIMADLRDSGAIEQDADIILFVYRDEVYNEDTLEQGVAEIIIGKQRNGPLGTIKCRFIGAEFRFANRLVDTFT